MLLDMDIGVILTHETLLNQKQVISILGVSPSTLIRLEKGERELRPVYPSLGTKRYVASQVQAYIERISSRGH